MAGQRYAAELGTSWPSLHKALQRHGLGMPARNTEAVRQRAIEAASQRTGRPATPSLDPVFVALNHGEVPVQARSGGELAERVRRAEDYAVLGAGWWWWWWSCTQKATLPSPVPAPGRSPAVPNAPTAVTRIASSAASVTRPVGPAHQPTAAGAGTGCRRPLTHQPSQLGEVRFRADLAVHLCQRAGPGSLRFADLLTG